jgi:hypothetical protein
MDLLPRPLLLEEKGREKTSSQSPEILRDLRLSSRESL